MTPFFANYGFHAETDWMKEREADNPGDNVCSLDAGYTTTSETNCRKYMRVDEEILRVKSDGTTQDRGWGLGNVECKERTHQTTCEAVGSETV